MLEAVLICVGAAPKQHHGRLARILVQPRLVLTRQLGNGSAPTFGTRGEGEDIAVAHVFHPKVHRRLPVPMTEGFTRRPDEGWRPPDDMIGGLTLLPSHPADPPLVKVDEEGVAVTDTGFAREPLALFKFEKTVEELTA